MLLILCFPITVLYQLKTGIILLEGIRDPLECTRAIAVLCIARCSK